MQNLDEYDFNPTQETTSINDISISPQPTSTEEIHIYKPDTPKLTSMDSFCESPASQSEKTEKPSNSNFIKKVVLDRDVIFKKHYNIKKTDKELITETLDHFSKRFEAIDKEKEKFAKKVDMKKILRFKNLFNQKSRRSSNKASTFRKQGFNSRTELKGTVSSKLIDKNDFFNSKKTKMRKSALKEETSDFSLKKMKKARKQSENLRTEPVGPVPEEEEEIREISFSEILKEKNDSTFKKSSLAKYKRRKSSDNRKEALKQSVNVFAEEFEGESEVLQVKTSSEIRQENRKKPFKNKQSRFRLQTEGPRGERDERLDTSLATDPFCASFRQDNCLCDKFRNLALQFNKKFDETFVDFVVDRMTSPPLPRLTTESVKENDFRFFIKKRRTNDKKFRLHGNQINGKGLKENKGKSNRLNAFKKIFTKGKNVSDLKYHVAKRREETLNSYR